MQFICLTQVDARTKIPCLKEPMRHGPAFPAVKGLEIEWANESAWPSSVPRYFGICDDDAETSVPGVLQILEPEEYERLQAEELDARWRRTKKRAEEIAQFRLDALARERGYDSIAAACSYNNSTVAKYREEAAYAVKARDSMWMKLFQIFNEAESGTRDKAGFFEAVLDELPVLAWPS